MNIYLDLTREFNSGRLRAIISSGQAVVLHHLAIMSKDGDWLLREEDEAIDHVLGVLERRGARYRFGAPLAPAWMRGGWSSHFEFQRDVLRVRTDFVTRPPRISSDRLAGIWREQEGRDLPVVGLVDLVALKKTNREKDYVVIGEIARLLTSVDQKLLCSRSAREIMDLAAGNRDMVARLIPVRPLLGRAGDGLAAVEQELDAERRRLIHENEDRLRVYLGASERWAEWWRRNEGEIRLLPLRQAHDRLVSAAADLLPQSPGSGGQ